MACGRVFSNWITGLKGGGAEIISLLSKTCHPISTMRSFSCTGRKDERVLQLPVPLLGWGLLGVDEQLWVKM